MVWQATMNTPGYLPWDDDEHLFDTASDAWTYLAECRRDQEENTDGETYSDTVTQLDAWSQAGMGENTLYGNTPDYDGDHDLGIAYSVWEV